MRLHDAIRYNRERLESGLTGKEALQVLLRIHDALYPPTDPLKLITPEKASEILNQISKEFADAVEHVEEREGD